MPLSLRTAAQFCNVDEFLFWNSSTNEFDIGCLGRIKRIDTFVSLWNKASRRHNIFLIPGTDVSNVEVIKHVQSGHILLLSMTEEKDSWAAGDTYNEMHRAHKAGYPSGGAGTYDAMAPQGTGDNLGPVVPTAGTQIYLDVERSREKAIEETLGAVYEQAYITCSRNVAPLPGGFLFLGGTSYRVENSFWETGFLTLLATEMAPSYETATFILQGASSPVFDPATGALSPGTNVERLVSVQRDAHEVVGRPTGRDLEEKQTLYVYNRHIGFDPLPGMQVTFGGRTWRVTRVDNNIENLQWKVEIKP